MIAFAREKRLLLARLALVAPLPLPFNEVVAWPFLAAFWAAVGLFLARARRDAGGWLSPLAMNLLALGYLPLFALDLTVLWGGQVLRPLLHLALFALAVKLFAVTREADKWHAYIGIFFVTLAAIGTSVHPSVLLFLAVALALHVDTLGRFAWLGGLAAYASPAAAPAAAPPRRWVATATLLALAVAMPLFFLLPRIRSPYLVAAGAGTGTLLPATAFSDELGLDAIGRLRGSRAVALRFAYETPRRPPGEPRFKAATYEAYRGGRWHRSPPQPGRIRRRADDFFTLAAGRAASRVRVWLNPLGAAQLPLPVETLTVAVGGPGLVLDRGGAASVLVAPSQILEYEVALGEEPRSVAEPGGGEALAPVDVPPAVAELAARVMGEGGAAERAARLEEHLLTRYRYSLDFLGRGGASPIADFLLRNRRGHCELFASSMVLMLRSQGIPARLVSGYLGAERNPLEGYLVVRQSNRHAWVEAWVDGAWRLFDPTPPAGRPGNVAPGLAALATQAWDFVVFRWDRYVLTYGLADQLDLFMGMRDLLRRLAEVWRPGSAAVAAAAPEDSGAPQAAKVPPRRTSPAVYAAGLALLAAAAAFALARTRAAFTATRGWQRLRDRLRAAGEPVPDAAAPVEIHRRLAARFPDAAAPGGRLLAFYLRESFGGEELVRGERDEAREELARALAGIAGRRR